MRLSEFIKNYREEAELSQRQFALKCGLSNGYISLLESEVNPQTGKPIVPTIPQLSKLAFGMSISLNELIDQVEDIPIELASSSLADQIKPVEVRKLPVLGKVACGEPLFMDEEREYIDIKDAPKNVDFILIANGSPMSKTSWLKFSKKVFRKINAALGGDENTDKLNSMTFYTFRHTVGTRLYYMSGISTKYKAYLMGHTEQVFLSTYSHLDSEKEDVSVLKRIVL